VQPQGLPGQLASAQRARVGEGAVGLALDVALVLPLAEVPQCSKLSWVLHPLDHLQHCDKVDIVSVQHIGDELDQLLLEALVVLQPDGVEVKAERCPVAVEVALKVVPQHPGKLVRVKDVGAGGDKLATGQGLVGKRVVSSVKLVDHHFPDGVRPGGAVLGVAVTLVRHPVVKGVGPDGDAAKGGSDGGVVDKVLVGHHLKLLVSTHAKVGGSDSNHRSVGDIGETLDDQARSCHLSQPVIVAALGPIVRVVLVGDREDGKLMAFPVQFLDRRVVGVLVRHEEGSLDLAAVGVLHLPAEDVLVQVDVVRVDGAVEGDGDHLGDLGGVNVARNSCPVRGAEAVRKLALGEVTVWGPIRVLVDSASILVRAVGTVGRLVAEKCFCNALTVAALQLAVGADWLVGLQVGQRSLRLGEPVAVVNLGLPVACLPEYVKGKTGGATNSSQPDGSSETSPVAPDNVPAVSSI